MEDETATKQIATATIFVDVTTIDNTDGGVTMEMIQVALPVGVGLKDTTVGHVSRKGYQLLNEGRETGSSNVMIYHEK